MPSQLFSRLFFFSFFDEVSRCPSSISFVCRSSKAAPKYVLCLAMFNAKIDFYFVVVGVVIAVVAVLFVELVRLTFDVHRICLTVFRLSCVLCDAHYKPCPRACLSIFLFSSMKLS